MIRPEFWNLGLTTEFMSLFLKSWWRLEREEIILEGVPSEQCFDAGERADEAVCPGAPKSGTSITTNPKCLKAREGEKVVQELLTAVTVRHNHASQRVLVKAGFELVREWEEEEDDRSSRRNVDKEPNGNEEGASEGERKKVVVGMMSFVLRRPVEGF